MTELRNNKPESNDERQEQQEFWAGITGWEDIWHVQMYTVCIIHQIHIITGMCVCPWTYFKAVCVCRIWDTVQTDYWCNILGSDLIALHLYYCTTTTSSSLIGAFQWLVPSIPTWSQVRYHKALSWALFSCLIHGSFHRRVSFAYTPLMEKLSDSDLRDFKYLLEFGDQRFPIFINILLS